MPTRVVMLVSSNLPESSHVRLDVDAERLDRGDDDLLLYIAALGQPAQRSNHDMVRDRRQEPAHGDAVVEVDKGILDFLDSCPRAQYMRNAATARSRLVPSVQDFALSAASVAACCSK